MLRSSDPKLEMNAKAFFDPKSSGQKPEHIGSHQT
jgi:hypothetical protein